MEMQRIPTLYFAPSEIEGLGVFTSTAISNGSLLEICPIIKLGKKDTKRIKKTNLFDYFFSWGKKLKRSAIVLGYGSLYNHSKTPNAEFRIDYNANVITFHSIKNISIGEEITTDYHAGLKGKKLWFKVKKA